jgi:hypothetical protein
MFAVCALTPIVVQFIYLATKIFINFALKQQAAILHSSRLQQALSLGLFSNL